MISQLKQGNWVLFFRDNIVILLATSLACYLSWFVTLSYSLKDGLASWYFPAGIVIVAALHLKFRYWLALFVGVRLGHYLYLGVPEITSVLGALWVLIVSVANQIVPLLGIVFIKLKKIPIRLDLVNSALSILAAALFYRVMRFIQYFLTDAQSLYGGVDEEYLFELFALHIVTGFVAIFICLILIFTLKDARRYWMNFALHDKYVLVSQLLGLLIAVMVLYEYQTDSLYMLKVVLFIPLVWFAYRFGWLGAMLFVSGLILMILVLLFRSADEALILEYQPYIISYSLVAILVGAIVNENNGMQKQLLQKNTELGAQNIALESSNTKIRGMAKRMTEIRENERNLLSEALHDEFGQSITAMKMGIYIVEKKSRDVDAESLAIVKKNADEIYNNVYDLLHLLRPKIMDDIGLHQTIMGSYFKDKMMNHNIQYHPTVRGDVERVLDSHKTAIFRIIQEATTNALKHANAQHIYVHLNVGSNDLVLSVEDDGHGKSACAATSEGGFGLLGIEDKVMSLGGHVQFDVDGKFLMIVSLPLCSKI